MSKELVDSVDIDAPTGTVWEVLAEFTMYPAWNPFIVSAEGELEVGRRLTLRMQPVGGSAVTMRPTVVEVVEGCRLRWLGRLGVRGLCDAEHVFTIEPNDAGGSRLVQREVFRGLLVPLLAGSLDRGTLPAFRAMDAALKDRAERVAAARG